MATKREQRRNKFIMGGRMQRDAKREQHRIFTSKTLPLGVVGADEEQRTAIYDIVLDMIAQGIAKGMGLAWGADDGELPAEEPG